MVPRLKISFPPATGYNRPWTSTVNSGTGVLKYCIAFLPPFTQETNGLYSGRVPRRGRAIDFHSDERLSIITIKTWPLFAVTSWLGNIGYKREIGDTKFQIYIYIYTDGNMGSLTLYNIALTPCLRLCTHLKYRSIFFPLKLKFDRKHLLFIDRVLLSSYCLKFLLKLSISSSLFLFNLLLYKILSLSLLLHIISFSRSWIIRGDE